MRSSANRTHFTASFCVIRIAAASGKARSARVERVMVGKGVVGGDDAQRRAAGRRSAADSPMPATACTARPRHARGSATRVASSEVAPRQRLVRHQAYRAPTVAGGRSVSTATSRTTASTVRRRDAGSRSGPAGSRQPLPRPRAPSTTAISIVARQRVVLQSVVAHDDVALRVRGEQTPRGGRRGRVRSRPATGRGEDQRLVADDARHRRRRRPRARRRALPP